MKAIIEELKQGTNVRTNLSNLRKEVKDPQALGQARELLKDQRGMVEGFLSSEDAKTRKNAALLIGDLKWQESLEALYHAYQKDGTRFVRSSYLQAMGELDCRSLLPELKGYLEQLRTVEITDDNRKHMEEETRELQKIIIRYDGIIRHKFSPVGKTLDLLLITNRNLRENIAKSIPEGKVSVHPLGVEVITQEFTSVSKIRTYRELLFMLQSPALSQDPKQAAAQLWEGNLYSLLCHLHTEGGTFYYRLECRGDMDLEARSSFARKFTAELDLQAGGRLVNSPSDYEVEIRLFESKDGRFFPCLKLYTYADTRFHYRKNTIPASMNPATAALICELAAPYLKENAQIIDPFCGVGTMLIERNRKVPARDMYACDIFGDAILLGRENAALAKTRINFIHRDFFDFHHEYLFDEVITDMPMRGKRTDQEMDDLYRKFLGKLQEILAEEAVIIIYTNETSLLKKQLRLHRDLGLRLLQETNMQKGTKTRAPFDLIILGKGM